MNLKRINGYLEGIYTLKSPLSHIGDSHGPDSYLATQDIIGPNGKPVEVFTFSGNAIRGMLRDCGAKYMLDRLAGDLSRLQIPLDIFYLLFSGGSIGGDQKVDIDMARKIRQNLPVLSVFGGGVGNQILAGKLCCNDAYPICIECAHIVPQEYIIDTLISWRQMTEERSYTRTDDAKDENKREYLKLEPEEVLMLEPGEQVDMFEGQQKEKKKENPQQMRYTIEVMQVGTRLWHRMDVKEMTELEFGAMISCIVEWGKHPYIGGQSRIGMGHCSVAYNWHPIDGEVVKDFMRIGEQALLSPPAQEAKAKYDDFLDTYKTYLDEHKEEAVKLLDADTSKS